MGSFQRLLDAKTTTEFFVIWGSMLEADAPSIIEVELTSVVRERRFALRLSIEQLLRSTENGINTFYTDVTHVFTLYEDGSLTWAMKGHPTITGLQAIQERLQMLRHSLEHDFLPAEAEMEEEGG